jgi:predicted nucleotidyltransferase
LAERRFDPRAVLRVLVDHEVRFVVIGGYAAVLHGSAMFTYDADICPDPHSDNLDRLCFALTAVGARIRSASDPDGVAFRCDSEFLAGMTMLNLVTDHGDFDVSLRPSGTDGYADLLQGALEYDLDGLVVKVAGLDDIIRSKEAAARDKDRAALPQLYALRDEIARLEE